MALDVLQDVHPATIRLLEAVVVEFALQQDLLFLHKKTLERHMEVFQLTSGHLLSTMTCAARCLACTGHHPSESRRCPHRERLLVVYDSLWPKQRHTEGLLPASGAEAPNSRQHGR